MVVEQERRETAAHTSDFRQLATEEGHHLRQDLRQQRLREIPCDHGRDSLVPAEHGGQPAGPASEIEDDGIVRNEIVPGRASRGLYMVRVLREMRVERFGIR